VALRYPYVAANRDPTSATIGLPARPIAFAVVSIRPRTSVNPLLLVRLDFDFLYGSGVLFQRAKGPLARAWSVASTSTPGLASVLNDLKVSIVEPDP
jgi:hypothetical protein